MDIVITTFHRERNVFRRNYRFIVSKRLKSSPSVNLKPPKKLKICCCLNPQSDFLKKMAPPAKPISSPVPDAWYPTLAVLLLAFGLVNTASFFIYEATSSRKNRKLAKELTTCAVSSVFLGFGSLFLLLSSGVYV